MASIVPSISRWIYDCAYEVVKDQEERERPQVGRCVSARLCQQGQHIRRGGASLLGVLAAWVHAEGLAEVLLVNSRDGTVIARHAVVPLYHDGALGAKGHKGRVSCREADRGGEP